MRRPWSDFCSCLLAGRNEPSRVAKARAGAQGSAVALGEAAQQNYEQIDAVLRIQSETSTSGRVADSPRAVLTEPRSARGTPLPVSPPPGPNPSEGTASPDTSEQAQLARQPEQQQQQQEQQQEHQQPQEQPGKDGPVRRSLSSKGSRLTAASVRFATSLDLDAGGGNAAAAAAAPAPSTPTSDVKALGGGGTRAGPGAEASLEFRPSRVRLLLPRRASSASSVGSGGGSGAEEEGTGGGAPAAPQSSSRRRSIGAAFVTAKGDGESRALAQLASLLLARHVDYRAELEEVMMTHGSAFPKAFLEQMLRRNGVPLPQRHLRVLLTLYRFQDGDDEDEQGERAEERRGQREQEGTQDGGGKGEGRSTEGGEPEDDLHKIDGLALLKDLDRATFRYIALGTGSTEGAGPGHPRPSREVHGGTGPSGAAKGTTASAGNSKKSLTTSAHLGDKTRILQLVSMQLEEDATLRLRTGSDGEGLTTEHLKEVVEQIDLTSVAVPVGTKARYVPATDDPDSFQVPVWSLRAMSHRKQQRDQLLSGSEPGLRHLGQAGKDALRKRITRRSMFQQQEIIAHAVVAAARAAVAPSARLAQGAIQLSGASRITSLQRNGSKNSNSSRRSSTCILASAAVEAPAEAAATNPNPNPYPNPNPTGAAVDTGTVEGDAAATALAGSFVVTRWGPGAGGGGGQGCDAGAVPSGQEEEGKCEGVCPPGFVDGGCAEGGGGPGGGTGPSPGSVGPRAGWSAGGGEALDGVVARVGSLRLASPPGGGSGEGDGGTCRRVSFTVPSWSRSTSRRSSVTSPQMSGLGGGGSGGGAVGGPAGSSSPGAPMRPWAAPRNGSSTGGGWGDGVAGGGGGSSGGDVCSPAGGSHRAPSLRGMLASPPAGTAGPLLGAPSRKALGAGQGGMMILPVLIVAAPARAPELSRASSPQPDVRGGSAGGNGVPTLTETLDGAALHGIGSPRARTPVAVAKAVGAGTVIDATE